MTTQNQTSTKHREELSTLANTLEKIVQQYRSGRISSHSFANRTGRVHRAIEVVNAKIEAANESEVLETLEVRILKSDHAKKSMELQNHMIDSPMTADGDYRFKSDRIVADRLHSDLSAIECGLNRLGALNQKPQRVEKWTESDHIEFNRLNEVAESKRLSALNQKPNSEVA